MLWLIYNIHTYIAKTWLSFYAHTDRCETVNWLIFRIFRSIYTQHNHTQSSNSALFTCWIYIHHTHIHCKDMTQLLHIYRLAWCSKSIDFFIFRLIYTHCNHIQSSNSAWLSIEFIYNIHTYIAKTWFSFCTSTRLHNAVNWSIFCFIRSIYIHCNHMHCNHIHCKNMTQSLLIYTE